jgi:hypothetical protein
MRKKIIAPDNKILTVDALMKPVLIHLWNRGIKTLDSCAGHSPDYSAYIRIERNTGFEQYAMRGHWETDTSPMTNFELFLRGEIQKPELKDAFKNTGKTAFTVYACHDKEKKPQAIRGQFLRWLLGY